MYSSQGIMVDNHPNPRVREVWLLTIISLATVHQLIYILSDWLVHYHSYEPI